MDSETITRVLSYASIACGIAIALIGTGLTAVAILAGIRWTITGAHTLHDASGLVQISVLLMMVGIATTVFGISGVQTTETEVTDE